MLVISDEPALGVDPPRATLRPPGHDLDRDTAAWNRRQAALCLDKARGCYVAAEERDRLIAAARCHIDLAGQIGEVEGV